MKRDKDLKDKIDFMRMVMSRLDIMTLLRLSINARHKPKAFSRLVRKTLMVGGLESGQ